MTVNDINWSCPADLEPYSRAHKLELQEKDSIIYSVCGNYVISAVAVAVDRCLNGKKAKSEYTKNLIMSDISNENGYSESNEEVAVYEAKQRTKLLEKQGLPKSPV